MYSLMSDYIDYKIVSYLPAFSHHWAPQRYFVLCFVSVLLLSKTRVSKVFCFFGSGYIQLSLVS